MPESNIPTDRIKTFDHFDRDPKAGDLGYLDSDLHICHPIDGSTILRGADPNESIRLTDNSQMLKLANCR